MESTATSRKLGVQIRYQVRSAIPARGEARRPRDGMRGRLIQRQRGCRGSLILWASGCLSRSGKTGRYWRVLPQGPGRHSLLLGVYPSWVCVLRRMRAIISPVSIAGGFGIRSGCGSCPNEASLASSLLLDGNENLFNLCRPNITRDSRSSAYSCDSYMMHVISAHYRFSSALTTLEKFTNRGCDIAKKKNRSHGDRPRYPQ